MKKIYFLFIISYLLKLNTFAQDGWFLQNSAINAHLYSVFFIDHNFGWIAGEDGTLLYTSNGGVDWISQISNTITDLHSIHFEDQYTGWSVGEEGKILKTTDDGITWITQTSNTINRLNSIYFIDNNTGWIVGQLSTILKTTDGGLTWVSKTSGTLYELRSVCFTDQNTGWAAGGIVRFFPPSFLIPFRIILKTSDGGETWVSQLDEQDYDIFSIYFIDQNTGWAISVAGNSLLKTNDGGTSWILLNSASGGSIYFVDKNTGWKVGGNSISKSTNGGINWVSQISGTNNSLRSVYFTDQNIGWTVGTYGTILKTTDGGAHWIDHSGSIVSIKNDEIEIPQEFLLYQNYPNPFNPTTTIKIEIPKSSMVNLKVYDILGIEVATLVNEEKPAGSYEVEFDGNGLSSGIYFYKLQAEKFSSVKKMILMK